MVPGVRGRRVRGWAQGFVGGDWKGREGCWGRGMVWFWGWWRRWGREQRMGEDEVSGGGVVMVFGAYNKKNVNTLEIGI